MPLSESRMVDKKPNGIQESNKHSSHLKVASRRFLLFFFFKAREDRKSSYKLAHFVHLQFHFPSIKGIMFHSCNSLSASNKVQKGEKGLR